MEISEMVDEAERERKQQGQVPLRSMHLLDDSKRLDWLEENQVTVFSWTQDDQYGAPSRKLWQCNSVGLEKARDNIRDAIDAAMSSNAELSEPGGPTASDPSNRPKIDA